MPNRDPVAGACPCGSAIVYALCCGPLHAGAAAANAGALMRSRYAAYVLGLGNYLLATWHASTRPATIELDPDTRWLGLQVRRCIGIDADHAQVEFVARCRHRGGSATRMHELSDFVREDGRWFYVDGRFL
jgi:SEC-C motif-containing protein